MFADVVQIWISVAYGAGCRLQWNCLPLCFALGGFYFTSTFMVHLMTDQDLFQIWSTTTTAWRVTSRTRPLAKSHSSWCILLWGLRWVRVPWPTPSDTLRAPFKRSLSLLTFPKRSGCCWSFRARGRELSDSNVRAIAGQRGMTREMEDYRPLWLDMLHTCSLIFFFLTEKIPKKSVCGLKFLSWLVGRWMKAAVVYFNS